MRDQPTVFDGRTADRVLAATRRVESTPSRTRGEPSIVEPVTQIEPARLASSWSLDAAGEWRATFYPVTHAAPVDPDHDADDAYHELTSEGPHYVWAPTCPREDDMTAQAPPVGGRGLMCWVVYRGRWEFLMLEDEPRRFVLLANLAPGGEAEADLQYWDPSGSGSWSTDTGNTFTVRDTSGYRWGPTGSIVEARPRPAASEGGSSSSSSSSSSGAIASTGAVVWEVVDAEHRGTCTVTHIRATVDDSEGVETTDGTITIASSPSIMLPAGGFWHDGHAEPSSIENTHAWALDDEATVEAVWNAEDEQWEAVQGDCPTPTATSSSSSSAPSSSSSA